MSAAPTRIRFAFSAFLMVCTTIISVAGAPLVADASNAETCRGRAVTILGTPGADEITGTDGNDVIKGRGGNDIINGGKGSDIICGDGGDDIIHGNRGNDWLFGGPGNDQLYGQRGHDRLFGFGGTDSLFGGLYADVCVGENEANCETDYRGERDEEEWRDLVDEFFGDIDQTNNALRIIACESNGDPFAVNPNGNVPKGLWQFIPSTWEWATPFTGWDHEHRFHPRAATETARWLYDWADGRIRQDGSVGQGFDPWVHCRCLLAEYDCPFDISAVEGA